MTNSDNDNNSPIARKPTEAEMKDLVRVTYPDDPRRAIIPTITVRFHEIGWSASFTRGQRQYSDPLPRLFAEQLKARRGFDVVEEADYQAALKGEGAKAASPIPDEAEDEKKPTGRRVKLPV